MSYQSEKIIKFVKFNYKISSKKSINFNLPANSNAINPTFSAFNDTRVRRVKTTGRITADLNLRANKIGNISFFSLPRASEKLKEKKIHFPIAYLQGDDL